MNFRTSLMSKNSTVFASIFRPVLNVVHFYVEGFRNMTWGRVLWLIIVLKLIVIFLVLRLFFLKPVLSGMDEQQKEEHVATMLAPKDEKTAE